MRGWRRIKLVWAAALLLSITLLQACGNNDNDRLGIAAVKLGGKIKLTWSTWGSPGDMARFQDFTKDYNAKHPNVEVELIPVPGEYEQKLLTQLSGGTAPDAFYANPDTLIKLIDNQTVAELTPYIASPSSPIKESDFFAGLWGPARQNGNIYGVPVDCNPIVMWYNPKLLQDAGIAEMPAELYERGGWNWGALQAMLVKLRASGKLGLVLDNSWYRYYSFLTSNGGTVYNEKGEFVADRDAKSVEAYKFLYDNMKAGTMTYTGSLPKGQGSDAMFMSQQAGFVTAGRWYLTIFKQNKDLQYDVVPFPTHTGRSIEPASIPSAYMVLNKATKHPQETYDFISAFVSRDGQIFRLQGGGNAVPSVAGADAVVGEGRLPRHYQYFLDAREAGYVMMPAEAAVPGLTGLILNEMDALWLKDTDFTEAIRNLGEKANRKIQEYNASAR